MNSKVSGQLKLAVSGIDCPTCAVKLEKALQHVPGVSTATMDFPTSMLYLTLDGVDTTVLNEVQTTVSRIEPDVRLTEVSEQTYPAEHNHSEHEGTAHHTWLRLGVGAILYAVALLLPGDPSIWTFLPSYLVLGWPTIWRALRTLGRAQLFNENFLMSLATLGALAIGEYAEAVAVMLFYEIGEFFQDLAVGKSQRSIKALMDLRPDYANVIQPDGSLQSTPPEKVQVGSYIAVKPGERIPLDGIIESGESFLDTSALTGESVPRQAHTDDEVLAGFVNSTGLLQVRVTREYHDSAIARVLEMTKMASARKAPTERFITRFARYYTPAVVVAALALAFVPPLIMPGQNWQEWTYRALIFLVVSCPCALVLSVPLGFFGGIGGAARQGILVKGANYLERLAHVDTVVFDKTGTLTKGVFQVAAIEAAQGVLHEDVLAMAASAERFSVHPIAESIRKAAVDLKELPDMSQYQELAGEGVLCSLGNNRVGVGNRRLMERMGVEVPLVTANGTVVYVAKDDAYLGHMVIADELKEDARVAVQQLRRDGVRRLIMLTGDRYGAADAIAQALNLDEVHAELLPDGKLATLEKLTPLSGNLVFVGDGINDAPVLARADVGVAMGALGSDAAIEAADVVLMTDEPSRLATAVHIARRTKTIVWQNVALSLGVKGVVLALGTMGLASMWEAVFADVGIALLAVLNSMRTIRAKPDTITP